MKRIYLDHNATSPLAVEVAQAMQACRLSVYGNPASQHATGRQARKMLEDARERIARLLSATVGMNSDRVILTSGGTEANNLALFGLAGEPPGRIVISAIEHPSVSEPAERLGQLGFEICTLSTDQRGVVDPDQLQDWLDGQTRLVSVMLGNHETGVLQPVEKIADLCGAAGVPLHIDAVQAAGKLDVDFRALGATAMTVSGHKLGGPAGIGALIVRNDAALTPLMRGGQQQGGLRPGTESVPLAVGLAQALENWRSESPTKQQKLAALRDRFEKTLQSGWPDLVVNGGDAPRLPQTSNLAFVGLDRQALFMALDQAGVDCSTGSACASGSSELSPVLLSMGLPEAVVGSSLRFSLGPATSQEQIDQAARRILQVCSHLGERKRP